MGKNRKTVSECMKDVLNSEDPVFFVASEKADDVFSGLGEKKTENRNDQSESSDASVIWYLKQINKISVLPREEEDRLARLSFQGDEKARHELVKSNLRFVVTIAKKYQSRGLSLLDLINEGNVGLMKAAEKFNPDMGFHFISYAVWWIRQAILTAISQKAFLIRIPLNRTGDLRKIEYITRILEQSLGREPSASEIADQLEMEESDVRHLRAIAGNCLSIDSEDSSEFNEAYIQTIEDDQTSGPEISMVEGDLKSMLGTIISSLPEKERKVVEMRFGLNGLSPMTLAEIGDELYLSRERVRQIQKNGLQRIRMSAGADALKAFMSD